MRAASVLSLLLVVIFNGGLCCGQAGNDKPLTAEQVRRSIKLGIGFLANKQLASGGWPEPRADTDGGVSCLATLALINAGWKVDSPAAQRAFDYILGLSRQSTYVVSLRVMALSAADARANRFTATVRGDLQWLLNGQSRDGGWGYGDRGSGDGSNTQFALLALNEARRYEFLVPRENWLLAKQYWEQSNSQAGWFSYSPAGLKASGSMTCAGIASLTIIRENLFDLDQQANGGRAKCCDAGADDIQRRIDRGIDWLAERFTVRGNPTGSRQQSRQRYYYLYALERAGRFTGRRFIGAHDWYRVGAKELVRSQKGAKWLDSTSAGFLEDNPLVTTSFALLFLSKGRRPVAIGKYDHGAPDYDLHPRGVHYLTREIEEDWDQKLNWQTVRARGASVNDLFEAPVLFMSGRDAIGLSAAEKKVLKDYIENGGFLFAEACQGNGCGAAPMDAAFRELMIELFPDSDLQPLAPGHTIWTAQYKIGPNKEWPLLGLQACCRTSVVYCPANLACYWSLSRPGIKNNKAANPQLLKRIEYCKRVGINVVSYATGRQLDDKLDTQVVDNRAVSVLTDRALVLPKLSHNGGADDAPNAWSKVLKELANNEGLEVKIEKTMIGPDKKSLADYPFIFVHGRNKFSFTPEQRKAIRGYLQQGGFILADSICASEAFSRSFRLEMKEIIGRDLSPIPAQHELWTDSRYGETIQTLTLRIRDANAEGGFRKDPQPPEHFDGIEFGGRLAVMLSRYDLSCALENKSVSSCSGYTRDDAMKVCRKIVLYSLLSDTVPGN